MKPFETGQQPSGQSNAYAAGSAGRECRPLCPCCGRPLCRIPRRRMDLLLSIILPVRRYACGAMLCQWTGLRRGTRESHLGGIVLEASDESCSR